MIEKQKEITLWWRK